MNGQESISISLPLDSSDFFNLNHSVDYGIKNDNLMDLILQKEANDDFLAKKERNRLNSKFTRDRKKLLQVEMQQLIAFMERQNRTMQENLCRYFKGDHVIPEL